MIYVLDASAALPCVLPEAYSPQATRLRDQYNQMVIDLIAPDFFIAEVGNSLVMAERQGRIAPGQGAVAFDLLLQDRPILHPSTPIADRAFELALKYRLAIYDLVYVALAEREGCEFITNDQKCINALQRDFPFIVPLSAFP